VYDFSRCKLCENKAAVPTYKLKNTTIYVCAACDFHFINYLDTLTYDCHHDETRALDQASCTYIESKLFESEKKLQKNLLLVKQYRPLSKAHCLDIGVGAGLFINLLLKSGAVVHGIEPQKIFREFAQKKFGITIHRETIDDHYWQQGFAGYFNIITLWDVLEHVNFPAETLKNAYNVTEAGGWLFLDTPRRDSFFYKLGELSYKLSGGSNPFIFESIYSSQPYRHKQLFTLQQLIQLVEKIGFSVVHLNTSLFKPQNKMILVCRKPM
jgi:2-polyprenyl-6-hydroxyphenyl methylase/3-demethylubiquinone-9 3-methyltransferase